MAVLSVEVFARTNEAESLSATQQYSVYERVSDALLPPQDAATSGSTLVLDAQVTPHESGAYISALCVADAGTTASEAIADRITKVLADVTEGHEWQLRAGVPRVLLSDN